MAEPPEYTGDGGDDLLEPFAVTNEVLIELIKSTKQPEILNVRMVMESDAGEDDSTDSD